MLQRGKHRAGAEEDPDRSRAPADDDVPGAAKNGGPREVVVIFGGLLAFFAVVVLVTRPYQTAMDAASRAAAASSTATASAATSAALPPPLEAPMAPRVPLAAPVAGAVAGGGGASIPLPNFAGETVRLRNGLEMPAVGFGTCCRATAKGEPIVESTKLYLKHGGRLIDTAMAYANHPEIGRAVRESGVPRAELWITSKVARSPDRVWWMAASLGVVVRRMKCPSVAVACVDRRPVSSSSSSLGSKPLQVRRLTARSLPF